MNRIKLHKQVGTMKKEQLICLCKSLIDINCELEDKKNKAIEYIEEKTTDEDTGEELGYSDNINYKELLDILRGDKK